MGKTVRPRTNLLLDIGLFSLALFHVSAAVSVNIILHDEGLTYVSWHRVLGFTGVMLFLVVSLHLGFHLPWIKAQFQQLVRANSRKQAGGKRGESL